MSVHCTDLLDIIEPVNALAEMTNDWQAILVFFFFGSN